MANDDGFVVASCSFPSSSYKNPHFVDDRKVMVHLMEWLYEDIALEAELFLGPQGYGGVQVSPVNEHAILSGRPWYERYQPVSYQIETRSGNEQQFRDMVHRCNKVGIRVYVDIVLNHMTGGQIGFGTAGNAYNGHQQQYPGVPFGPEHFNNVGQCPTDDLEIHDFDDPVESRNCRLWGLRDLNQSLEYVKNKQIEFLNRLIDAGVAGFRSDASTHMWPDDLRQIFSRVKDLNPAYFPPNSRPFIYHETIYYGGNGINSAEYTKLGRIIEFRFWKEITNVFRGNNQLRWLRNFGPEWSLVSGNDALVMIDSHDLRVGHNGDLSFNINCFHPRLLTVATAFMLAWNYGVPRVMSSYRWPQQIDPETGKDLNEWCGPPLYSQGGILSAFHRKSGQYSFNWEWWMGEHRWHQIHQMVRFKNVVERGCGGGSCMENSDKDRSDDQSIENWWDNGGNQIAFSRGKRGFISFNMEQNIDLDQYLQTGLPAGQYCDIISGKLKGGHCTGKCVMVDQQGFACIRIGHKDPDRFLAIHLDSKLNCNSTSAHETPRKTSHPLDPVNSDNISNNTM